MCSMRCGARGGTWEGSPCSRTRWNTRESSRLARSPMACTEMASPAALALRRASSMASMGVSGRPVVGSSAYGSSIQAECTPWAPSAKYLQCPTRRQSSPMPVRRPRAMASSSRSPGRFIQTRKVDAPSALRACHTRNAWAPSGAPIRRWSWIPVRPIRFRIPKPSWKARATSVSDLSGTRAVTRLMARSRRMPVGRPAASLSITPMGGSVWPGPIPARRKASELTRAKCRPVRQSSTG